MNRSPRQNPSRLPDTPGPAPVCPASLGMAALVVTRSLAFLWRALAWNKGDSSLNLRLLAPSLPIRRDPYDMKRRRHRGSVSIGLSVLVACLLTSLSIPIAVAQLQAALAGSTTAESMRVAPVAIDGHVLFNVRGASAFPPEQRAALIAARIRTLAASDVAIEDIKVTESGAIATISAPKQLLMGVVDADARLEGVERLVLVQIYEQRIADAVRSYRAERMPHTLLIHGIYVLIATALVILASWTVVRATGGLDAQLERRYRSHLEVLQIHKLMIITAEQLWAAIVGFLRAIRVLMLLVIFYVYLQLALGLFPWTRSFANRLSDIVVDPLSTIGAALIGFVPDLVFLAVLVVITRYLVKLARLFFDALANRRLRLKQFEPEWAWPTYRIVRLSIIIFAIVVAYPYIPGSSTAAFKGISILVGVIVSLGSSTVIANIVAGYTMTYRRAFRNGDLIKVQDTLGHVLEMRLLVTRVRSFKNEEVVIPNSLILSSEVVNYTAFARKQGLILHTTVSIGYEVPWRQVEAMLRIAAERTEGVLKDPPPFVLQRELGDFAVVYEVNGYCDEPSRMPAIYTGFHHNILDVFNEYEVQIMTPAYESDPHEPKVVPKSRLYASPASPPTADKRHEEAELGP